MSYSSGIDGILGQAEKEFASTSSSGNADLGKDAFLQLLVTQLSNQDPLNPMEDKEFVAELSQFSSLEQLTNLNEGMEDLIDATKRQDLISAVSFMGKEVTASGDVLSKSNGKVSDLSFTLEEDASALLINIIDESGNIVRTVDLDAMEAGTHTFSWDGLDYVGNEVEDGLYAAAVAAETSDGKIMLVSTEVSGVVEGIESSDGQYLLKLDNGRTVDFISITNVKDSSAVSDNADES